MVKRKYFIFVFFLVCILGCLFPACTGLHEEVDLPFSEPPIVVHCYLYPGMQVIEISVEYAHNIGGGPIPANRIPVKDAIVKLWSEIQDTIPIPFDENKKLFSSTTENFTIIEGVEYFLLIEHANHPPISARVRIPESNNEFFVEVTELDSDNFFRVFDIIAWVQDKPQKKNFYQLFGFLEGVRTCEIGQDTEEVPFSYSIFDYSPLTVDENRDGLSIFFPSRKLELFNSDSCFSRIDSLRYKLVSFEENTYLYIKSIEDFLDASESPFLIPQSPFTNIVNGLGIFGAYSVVEKVSHPDIFFVR